MFTLLGEVSWPSDFGVFEMGWVLIHESTHSFSPLSVHRSMVGRRRPFVRSALGRAMLSAASPALRREMLEVVASLVFEEAAMARDRRLIERIVSQSRRKQGLRLLDRRDRSGHQRDRLPIEETAGRCWAPSKSRVLQLGDDAGGRRPPVPAREHEEGIRRDRASLAGGEPLDFCSRSGPRKWQGVNVYADGGQSHCVCRP